MNDNDDSNASSYQGKNRKIRTYVDELMKGSRYGSIQQSQNSRGFTNQFQASNDNFGSKSRGGPINQAMNTQQTFPQDFEDDDEIIDDFPSHLQNQSDSYQYSNKNDNIAYDEDYYQSKHQTDENSRDFSGYQNNYHYKKSNTIQNNNSVSGDDGRKETLPNLSESYLNAGIILSEKDNNKAQMSNRAQKQPETVKEEIDLSNQSDKVVEIERVSYQQNDIHKHKKQESEFEGKKDPVMMNNRNYQDRNHFQKNERQKKLNTEETEQYDISYQEGHSRNYQQQPIPQTSSYDFNKRNDSKGFVGTSNNSYEIFQQKIGAAKNVSSGYNNNYNLNNNNSNNNKGMLPGILTTQQSEEQIFSRDFNKKSLQVNNFQDGGAHKQVKNPQNNPTNKSSIQKMQTGQSLYADLRASVYELDPDYQEKMTINKILKKIRSMMETGGEEEEAHLELILSQVQFYQGYIKDLKDKLEQRTREKKFFELCQADSNSQISSLKEETNTLNSTLKEVMDAHEFELKKLARNLDSSDESKEHQKSLETKYIEKMDHLKNLLKDQTDITQKTKEREIALGTKYDNLLKEYEQISDDQFQQNAKLAVLEREVKEKDLDSIGVTEENKGFKNKIVFLEKEQDIERQKSGGQEKYKEIEKQYESEQSLYKDANARLKKSAEELIDEVCRLKVEKQMDDMKKDSKENYQDSMKEKLNAINFEKYNQELPSSMGNYDKMQNFVNNKQIGLNNLDDLDHNMHKPLTSLLSPDSYANDNYLAENKENSISAKEYNPNYNSKNVNQLLHNYQENRPSINNNSGLPNNHHNYQNKVADNISRNHAGIGSKPQILPPTRGSHNNIFGADINLGARENSDNPYQIEPKKDFIEEYSRVSNKRDSNQPTNISRNRKFDVPADKLTAAGGKSNQEKSEVWKDKNDRRNKDINSFPAYQNIENNRDNIKHMDLELSKQQKIQSELESKLCKMPVNPKKLKERDEKELVELQLDDCQSKIQQLKRNLKTLCVL